MAAMKNFLIYIFLNFYYLLNAKLSRVSYSLILANISDISHYRSIHSAICPLKQSDLDSDNIALI